MNLFGIEMEFAQWMHKHSNKFRLYAPDEIARLALSCGFPIEVACTHISDYVTHVDRLLKFWESPLAGKWMTLREHETGKDRWE